MKKRSEKQLKNHKFDKFDKNLSSNFINNFDLELENVQILKSQPKIIFGFGLWSGSRTQYNGAPVGKQSNSLPMSNVQNLSCKFDPFLGNSLV